MSTRSFLYGAIGVVLLAMVVGAWVVGGPGLARRQTFDAQRLQELTALSGILICRDTTLGPALPAELTAEHLRGFCGGRSVPQHQLVDNEYNEPYKYTRKSDTEYAICARFHDAERVARTTYFGPTTRAFDPKTGCLTASIR